MTCGLKHADRMELLSPALRASVEELRRDRELGRCRRCGVTQGDSLRGIRCRHLKRGNTP